MSTAARHAGVGAPARRIPRRVSGPARRPATVRPPAPLRVLQGLARGRLLDRLLRSRAIIALVAVLLTGIVFTQVSLLKLNASIGRAVETSSTLQRQNSALKASVSRLSAGGRIQTAAEALGMVMPSASQLRFVHPSADAAARAVRNLRTPRAQPPTPPPAPVTSVTTQPAQGQTTTSGATTQSGTGTTGTGTTGTGTTQTATSGTGTTGTGTTQTGTTGTGTTGQSPTQSQGGSPAAAAGGAAAPSPGTAGG